MTDVGVGELHGSWGFGHGRFMPTVLSTEVGILPSRVSSLVGRPHKQVVVASLNISSTGDVHRVLWVRKGKRICNFWGRCHRGVDFEPVLEGQKEACSAKMERKGMAHRRTTWWRRGGGQEARLNGTRGQLCMSGSWTGKRRCWQGGLSLSLKGLEKLKTKFEL